jgi:hypothetical protein
VSADRQAGRPADCLSDFVLDRLVSKDLAPNGLEAAAARAHLTECARCAGRLAAFEGVLAPPLAQLQAKVDSGVEAATVHPLGAARRRARWAVPAAGLALAAGIAAVFALRTPGDGHGDGGGATRIKGNATLGVWARRASGETVRLGEGDAVAPGDALRFEIAAAQSGFVVVLGLDADGKVSVYSPADGATPPTSVAAGPPVTMPGSVLADDTLGNERIVALICAQSRPVDELTAAASSALARAGGDPRRVGGLGTPCAEAAFTIDKRR